MYVMPSNNNKSILHFWAGKGYDVGWLFSPDAGTRFPFPWMTYAIDNGRFSVWDRGTEWNEQTFLSMVEHYATIPHRPRWVAVPDVVSDRDETLREWERWFPVLSSSFDVPFAFVAQDGMSPDDVPSEASVVFVGGSYVWKWRNLKTWTEAHDRVHVGRVNSFEHLIYCRSLGVESVDGTGWFRHPKRTDDLEKFLRIDAGEQKHPEQLELFA